MKSLALAGTIGLCAACNQASDVVYQNDTYTWSNESVREGDYTAYAESAEKIVSNYPTHGSDAPQRIWEKKNDIFVHGIYQGATQLETALYNMAIDELINNIEPDKTIRTGALWPGVWTRDVSYSLILAVSNIFPEEGMTSLRRKVTSTGQIVEDTGTGGSWPCSTDRLIWSVAAWKLYLSTGDEAWLQEVYPVIKKSLETDFLTTYDAKTGLYRGESSFIDWREQSYPVWMQPADIHHSLCLGTNAVYYEAMRCAARMADKLDEPEVAVRMNERAEALKQAINRNLWLEEKGYYANYLYGRNYPVLSPRSETLGEALTILWDIASPEQARRMMQSMPVSAYGPTIFWPQICDQPNYHNNAIWPFVTGYWTKAAAKAGSNESMLHAFASSVRAASLFATNQENMSASTGNYAETELNSPNMLWSISGMLGTFHQLLLGMNMTEEGITFAPFVPKELAGCRTLQGFPYRGMKVNITVKGYGNGIKSCQVNGVEAAPMLPADAVGEQTVVIELDSKVGKAMPVNIQPYTATPAVPQASLEGKQLKWNVVENAVSYQVLLNGELIATTETQVYDVEAVGEYQVAAVDAEGLVSFVSEPVEYYQTEVVTVAVPRAGKDGINLGETITLTVEVPADGLYAIDWLYGNGHGETSQRNMCAIRSLLVDGTYVGVSLFPQRGLGAWELRGWSTVQQVRLAQGKHTVQLQFLPHNHNMNVTTNEMIVETLRCTRLSE